MKSKAIERGLEALREEIEDNYKGIGLINLFGEVEEGYETDEVELLNEETTKEQLIELNQITDKSIIDFIKQISSNQSEMDICLKLYNFINTPKHNKNYKNSYVKKIFNNIVNKNKHLIVKEQIQLTADTLNISFYAVRNHIYKK